MDEHELAMAAQALANVLLQITDDKREAIDIAYLVLMTVTTIASDSQDEYTDHLDRLRGSIVEVCNNPPTLLPTPDFH